MRHAPARFRARKGIALIVVLSCLMLIMLVFGVLIRAGLAEHQQIQAEERRLQAYWLVESGLERAADRLAAAEDYSGETWIIPAEELAGRDAGVAIIVVERVEGQPNRRLVRVQAEYPRNATRHARHTRQTMVDLREQPKGEKP